MSRSTRSRDERAYLLIDTDTLREKRHLLGFTQEELGERVGVTGAMISLLETGERAARRELVVRLAGLLGVEVDSLIIGEKEPLQPAKYLVGTVLTAAVANRDGVLHRLTDLVASQKLSIRSLATDADAVGTGTITMIVDPVRGAAREALRQAVQSIPDVHQCSIRNLKQPLAGPAATVMPVTMTGGTAEGLRLVAVGLADSPGRVTVAISGVDRVGLMRDLARVIARDFRLGIAAAGSSTDAGQGFVWFMIERKDERTLRRLVEKMRQVGGVQQVLVLFDLADERAASA